MSDERLYLDHIIEASARLKLHLKGGKQEFLHNPTVQDAVVKVLGNLTESTNHLEDATKEAYPHIPWPMIKAFRNVLVHDYLGSIDYEEVWDIISQDLGELVDTVHLILREKYGKK